MRQRLKIERYLISLFIVASELIYFFYIIPTKKNTANIVPTNIPFSTPTPTISKKANVILAKEIKGKILELNFTKISSIPDKNNIAFSFLLEMSNNGENKSNIFLYNDNDLKTMKIFDRVNNNISYKDLKVG
jgi:hypothetical protein